MIVRAEGAIWLNPFATVLISVPSDTIRNMFGCVCYFVVECDGVVECGWRWSIG